MAQHAVAPTSWLLQIPGLSHDPMYKHVNSGIVLTVAIAAFSVASYLRVKNKLENNIVPSPKFSLLNFADVCVETVYGIVNTTLGPLTSKHFGYLGTMFLFIWFSNLMNLLPLGGGPTSNLNTGLALAITSFVYYNYVGIKEMGLKGYLSHFLMGLGLPGLCIAVFELISHVLRPFTLSGRLFLNLEIDHAIVHAFENLFVWILPVPLLLFGIVVCTLQAFVFTTLTAVYIQMASDHEHEHDAEHGVEHAHH